MTLLVNKNPNVMEAGVDEVSRGCLFGAVYAAAVILDPSVPVHPLLNDSKKMSRKKKSCCSPMDRRYCYLLGS